MPIVRRNEILSDSKSQFGFSKRHVLLAAMGLALSVVGVAVLPGVVGAQSAKRVQSVATVGKVQITVAEMEKRLGQVPLFQLKMLGKTPEEVRKKFLDQLVGIEVMVQGAQADKLDQRIDVRDRIRSVLVAALKNRLRAEAAKARTVTDEAVKAYFEKHKNRYKSQLRIKLWQIVSERRADADKILSMINTDPKYKKDPVKGWEELARKHSIDRSTRMRKGNLGFVQPDGSTAHKNVKVDPLLVKAALAVKNGEVVPHPIKVGDSWVVLQRRGSHQTPERTLAMEAGPIRLQLSKQQVQEQLGKLRKSLHEKYVSDLHLDRVDEVEIQSHGEIVPKQRPGSLPRNPPANGRRKPTGRPGRMR